jgi:hypothetical protein
MRTLAAVREIRAGMSILIEDRDRPYLVASVHRFRGLVSITAYDPESVMRDSFGDERPVDSVTFVLNETDRVAVVV